VADNGRHREVGVFWYGNEETSHQRSVHLYDHCKSWRAKNSSMNILAIYYDTITIGL
jgi:hypothetical protein